MGDGGEKRKRKAIIKSGDGGGDRNDFNSEEKKFHEEGVLTGLSRLQLSRKLETQELKSDDFTHLPCLENQSLCIDYPLGFMTTLGGRQSPYHDPFFFTMGKLSHVSEHQEGDACLLTLTSPSLLRHLQGKGHT